MQIETLSDQLAASVVPATIIKMMKFFVLFFVFFVAANADYTTKYDNIDLDEILNNDRLFSNYYTCLLDTGKCTPDGAELKSSLPDAISTGCSKCSEKQKVGTEKVIKHLIEKKPDQWTALEKKYDPQGTYKAKYAEEAAKRGIKI